MSIGSLSPSMSTPPPMLNPAGIANTNSSQAPGAASPLSALSSMMGGGMQNSQNLNDGLTQLMNMLKSLLAEMVGGEQGQTSSTGSAQPASQNDDKAANGAEKGKKRGKKRSGRGGGCRGKHQSKQTQDNGSATAGTAPTTIMALPNSQPPAAAIQQAAPGSQ